MASWEIVALDTVTPQLRAPGGTDTYSVPKDMISATDKGYYCLAANQYGMGFQTSNAFTLFYANNRQPFIVLGTAPFGVNAELRLGLGASGAAGTSDVGIERTAAKVLKISDGGTATSSGAGVIQLPTFTVAGLPPAATAGAGGRASVSDATQTFTSANFGTTVTGGGANFVPVTSDGANWKIG